MTYSCHILQFLSPCSLFSPCLTAINPSKICPEYFALLNCCPLNIILGLLHWNPHMCLFVRCFSLRNSKFISSRCKGPSENYFSYASIFEMKHCMFEVIYLLSCSRRSHQNLKFVNLVTAE